MDTGRTLKLFLVDGAANGLVTAEIMNWTGHVLVGPRSRLAELIQRPESGRPALYILAGPDLGSSLQTEIYIGETSKATHSDDLCLDSPPPSTPSACAWSLSTRATSMG
jgi:hypothetical protein